VKSKLLQGFYLGDLLIEPLRGRVTGRAGSQHLTPKSVEVLLCLALEPGELVTREHLLDEVWGVGHGSQEALSHAIGEIRHVLDDHPDNPSFVQTLPKRGYRLLVEPELANETTSTVVLGTANGARLADIGFLENLKQRGVLETAIAYLIVGWLLIQIADIVFSQLHVPPWVGTFVTMLVISGFPIAMLLSWFLEFRDGRAIVHQLSPADARRRRFSRTYVSVIGALGLAAVFVFVYDRSVGLPEGADSDVVEIAKLPPIVQNSFAVLPFLNLDGSDETGVFANGLVDDVITRLSRVPGLRVSSRGDSFTLAPNTPSRQVRERLRVEMYLEGSVEILGDKIRVNVQLIDSETSFHLWSRTFNQPREGFFDIRDEITSLTVANVRVALPPDTRSSSLQATNEPTLDAYVLYRRGVGASRLPDSIDNINTALKWYDAALDVDPDYAAAHAGKCAMYVEAYSEMDDASYIAQAQTACATALALNPNLDVVHTALGDLYVSTGQYQGAESEYQKALAIDPSSAASLTGLGEIYRRQSRFDEAEASLRMAVDIHPGNSANYTMLGMFLFQTGRFTEAADEFQYVVALEHDNMNGHSNLGAAYMLMGSFDAAATAYQKAIAIEPTKTAYSNLGLMHYYLDDLDVAIDNLTSAVELKPNDYLARSNLGDALWIAGREGDALQAFEKAEAMAERTLQVNPSDPFTMMDLSWIKAMLNKHAEARTMIDKARGLAPDDPYSHYYDAMVFLRAGDTAATLAALEIAAAKGYSLQMLAAEPHLAILRNDPRFSAIVNAGSY